MAADYAYVALFLIVGALFVVFNIDILSRLIRPAKPTPVKLATYECGFAGGEGREGYWSRCTGGVKRPGRDLVERSNRATFPLTSPENLC